MNDKATSDTQYKHWTLSTDIDNVLWLSIDREGESANSLSMEVLSELGTIVDGLETDAPAGLVLLSGKTGSFIVGADVREFDGYDDAEMASDGIDRFTACSTALKPCRSPLSPQSMESVSVAALSLPWRSTTGLRPMSSIQGWGFRKSSSVYIPALVAVPAVSSRPARPMPCN